jgi:hypothetical protein
MGKRQQSQREILPDLYADEQREHRRDRHPHQQSADNCARLERKRKYADERNHLAWIRNNIKEEAEASKAALKANRLGVILEVEMEILNSISDRLLNVLFTYEEMRLWLQTKPDLAAELNVDLSHEVDPHDLCYMLTAALSVGSIPTGTAASLAKWREKIRTAAAREGKSSVTQGKNKKIAELVKEFRDRHPEWKRQDVARNIAIKLKKPTSNKIPNTGAVQRSPAFKKAWGAWTPEQLSASTKN